MSPHSKDPQRLTTHHSPVTISPSYFKLGLQYDAAAFNGLARDAFAAAMRAEGIAIDAGFRALHAIHSRRRFRVAGELPNAEDADRRVLTLHHPVLLGGEDDVRQFVTAVEKVRTFAAEIRERTVDSHSTSR
jgi:dTDP-4-amino-4,6-dideoxygalactose transaminase